MSPKYHPGYDSRSRRKIGESLETLPEILRGIMRVEGWLEVAALKGIVIPESALNDLLIACNRVLGGRNTKVDA